MNKNRRRGIALIAIALVLACIAGAVGLSVVQAANDQVRAIENQYGPQVYTLVVTKDIPARSTLTENSLLDGTLQIEKRPQTFTPDSAFVIPAPGDEQTALAVLGNRLNGFTLIPLKAGDILLPSMLETTFVIPPNMRAFSLAVDGVTSVSGYVRPGDHVDVLVSYQVNGANNQQEGRTEVVLQDIPILSTSWFNNLGATSAITATNGLTSTVLLQPGFTSAAAGESQARQMVVTLAVSLNDAEKLDYMANFAKEVRLVLRRADDSKPLAAPTLSPDVFKP